jgi:uncharacterized peroxidase-related enzyme
MFSIKTVVPPTMALIIILTNGWLMAFISYSSADLIPVSQRINDDDNILKIHRVHPRVMKLHHELYLELMHGDSALTPIQRELVAIRVSADNQCHYWIVHHSRGLKKLLNAQGLSDQEIDLKISSIMSDGAEYEFGKLESKMMQYATKLSLTPSEILETDVVELRNSGMTDLAIHDLCSIVAYFNFVNRIANGLGVELERWSIAGFSKTHYVFPNLRHLIKSNAGRVLSGFFKFPK